MALEAVNRINRSKVLKRIQSDLENFIKDQPAFDHITSNFSVIIFGGSGELLEQKDNLDRATIALSYGSEDPSDYLEEYRASMSDQQLNAKVYIQSDGKMGDREQIEFDLIDLCDGLWYWCNTIEPYEEIDPNITVAKYRGIRNTIDDKPGYIEANVQIILELHYDSSLY